jgi:hypothetical protein
MNRSPLRTLTLMAVIVLLPSGAWAEHLFDGHAVLNLRLSGPLSDLVDDRKDEVPYEFTLTAGETDYAVRLSPRGKSRLETCAFPPLRLTFTEPPSESSPFFGLERVKLVTPCRDVHNMEMNVYEEYAAYRMFNLLSDVSYRARLLNITYDDTSGELDGTHPAFAIEPTDHMAERLGGRERELPGVSRKNLDPDHASRMYVFQYLVGNTDWSLVTAEGDDFCCHNGRLLQLGNQLYLVPYDFDRTGLVDASYAKPAPKTRIRKVTQRRYRGYCMEDDAPLGEAVALTVTLEPEIMAIVDQLPGLEAADREKTRRFLAGFFEDAENEEALLDEFRRSCVG